MTADLVFLTFPSLSTVYLKKKYPINEGVGDNLRSTWKKLGHLNNGLLKRNIWSQVLRRLYVGYLLLSSNYFIYFHVWFQILQSLDAGRKTAKHLRLVMGLVDKKTSKAKQIKYCVLMIIQFSFAFSNELFNLYISAALSELFPFWCPSFSFLFPNVLFNRSIFPVLPALLPLWGPLGNLWSAL